MVLFDKARMCIGVRARVHGFPSEETPSELKNV